ncbi:MAG TPA: hypothetical protein VGJ84_05385 [Polyangiaceae bacterium]
MNEPRSPTAEREEREREHGRLERALPELIRRLVEVGYEKLTEGPENVRHFVSELKLPKEVLGALVAQVEETKNGLYRAVAREVRDFLERSNFSDELVRALGKMSLEIKTDIRFVPKRESPPESRRSGDRSDLQQSEEELNKASAGPPAEKEASQ